MLADIRTLALRTEDQARTDLAAIESELGVTQKQLARLLTRRELVGTALDISFEPMMLFHRRLRRGTKILDFDED